MGTKRATTRWVPTSPQTTTQYQVPSVQNPLETQHMKYLEAQITSIVQSCWVKGRPLGNMISFGRVLTGVAGVKLAAY